MQKLEIRIKEIGDESGKVVTKEFDDYRQFLAEFNSLRREYNIVNETTVSCIEVERKPDLFSNA